MESIFRPQSRLPCPARSLCTHSETAPRLLAILPKQLFLPLQAARQRQTTAEFKALYAKRAGVEGTISQAVNALHLRHARYIGLGCVDICVPMIIDLRQTAEFDG